MGGIGFDEHHAASQQVLASAGRNTFVRLQRK
jgi:hypothetical protein